MKKYIEVKLKMFNNEKYLSVEDTSFKSAIHLNKKDIEYLVQKLIEFDSLNLDKK